MLKFIVFLPFFFLVSCAPPEVEENDLIVERTTPDPQFCPSGDYNLKEGIETSIDLSVLLNDGETYSLNETIPGMTLDTATGILSGEAIFDNEFSCNIYEIQISSHDSLGNVTETSSTFEVVINGDPLRQETWHLNNTGQRGFTNQPSTIGVDINVFDVWKLGITGKDVRVAVSDTGVDIDHNDLYENASSGSHKNYVLDPPYTTNYPVPTTPHGTAVSGLIGGKGWNNEGGTGVAPDASISGFQFLSGSNFSIEEMVDQASGNYRIFNYSYGDFYTHPVASYPAYMNHLKAMTLGTPSRFYLKAAGNEFNEQSDIGYCGSHNANFPMENESPYMIVVGAVNSFGMKSSYSSAGSNLWVSAPGGEFGTTSAALLTTDLPTCFKGYSQTRPKANNEFEFGHPLNQKCNYTVTMNGTSGATPIVSGVIALMLEAYPNISYRDVKHILALTASMLDGNSSDDDVLHLNQLDHNPYGCDEVTDVVDFNIPDEGAWTYGQGWTKNHGIYQNLNEGSAGLKFHNYYGFGLVDAARAVELALALKNGEASASANGLPLPSQVEYTAASGTVAKPVPTKMSKGDAILPYADDELVVASPTDFVIESVQINVNLNHTWSIGEFAIELISPEGTRSILADANNTFMFQRNTNGTMTLTSHAFYGERTSANGGSWKLRVVDGAVGDEGSLLSWNIKLLGHRK